jgi:hypothetical protein
MWNMMAITTQGSVPTRLYPAATKSKPGIEPLPDERFEDKHNFTVFNIYGSDGSQLKSIYASVGNKGTLLISNKRLVFLFDKVPKTRSFFTPLALTQAAADVGKHRGEVFVGHLMYPWIKAVAARKQSVGLSNAEPRMRFWVEDGTSSDRVEVMVEVQMSKSPSIASKIVTLALAERTRNPSISSEADLHSSWAALAARPFDGPAKEFDKRTMSPFMPVSA